jgi:MFS transporter, OFA family, oxalate/formate antiporter
LPNLPIEAGPLSTFREFRSGIPLILTATVGSGVGMLGLSLYSLPFIAGAISAEFGWQRTDVTVAASFFVAGLAISGPFVGRLCDRVGVRPIIVISILLYGCGLAALSLFDGSAWQFYLGYFFLAVGGSGTTYAAYARVVNSWFDKARGLALGVMMSGPGVSAAALPFFLPPIVKAYGWRGGYVALGALALIALPPSLFFLRERGGSIAVTSLTHTGISLRQAMATRQFWAILVGTALVSAAISGTNLNMVDLLGRKGAHDDFIKSAASLYGVFSIVGRLIVGLTLDRIHGTIVSALMFAFTAASALFFDIANSWGLMLIAAAALGVSSGAEGDLCAYLASRYFGLKAFSEIFGWIFSALALGLAAGVTLARYCVKYTGTYDAWLLTAAAGCIVATVLFGTLGRYRSAELPEISVHAEHEFVDH